MKKLTKKANTLVSFSLFLLLQVLLMIHGGSAVKATPPLCSSQGVGIGTSNLKSIYFEGDQNNSFSMTFTSLQSGETYILAVHDGSATIPKASDEKVAVGGAATFTISDPEAFTHAKFGVEIDHEIKLSGPGINPPGFETSCLAGTYDVPFPYQCGNISVSQNYGGNTCYVGGDGCIAAGNSTKFTVTVLNSFGTPASGVPIIVNINSAFGANDEPCTTNASGTCSVTMSGVENGSNSLVIEYNDAGNTNLCSTSFDASVACQPDECSEEEVFIYNGSAFSGGEDPYILCNQINRAKFEPQYQDCIACTGGETEEDQEGVWTAIGCIKKAPAEIAQSLIRVGLMMGGGAALLTMLAAGFILSVSQGDPKRTEEAKDMITAAFIGLIFIIFSVSILQFIGFTILKIPGFGG